MNFKGLLVLIWMIVIFSFSNQPAEASSELSDGFINKTIIKVYEVFNGNIKEEKKEELISKYSYPVRKFAHFTIYFILGMLVSIYLNDFIKNKSVIIYSLLICFVYACTDEFHQYFVDGRYCSFIDVLIDSIGSLISILLLNVKTFLRKNIKR